MNYELLERRYLHDPAFHAAVAYVEHLMRDQGLTHQDIREIAFCAAMRQQLYCSRLTVFLPVDDR